MNAVTMTETPLAEIRCCLGCVHDDCPGSCDRLRAVRRGETPAPVGEFFGRTGRKSVHYGQEYIRVFCTACGWRTERKPSASGRYGPCRRCGREL